MKKFHLVSVCILLPIILVMGYWTFIVDNKDSSLELKDLQTLKSDLRRQRNEINYLKAKIRDLESANQTLQLVDKELDAVWNSASSREVTDDSRDADLAEEILKNPEFTKIPKQEADKTVAEIRENSEDSEVTKSLKQEVVRIVAGIRKKEREERQQRYTALRDAALQRRIDGYAKELNLNDSQKEELTKIAQEGLKKMQDVVSNFRDGELDQEQMRTEMDNVHQDIDKEVQQILSSDQYEQYKKEIGKFFN